MDTSQKNPVKTGVSMEKSITLEIELYDIIEHKKVSRQVTFTHTTNDLGEIPEWMKYEKTGRYHSEQNVFAARIGRGGQKLHSTSGSLIYFTDEAQATKCGWLRFGKKPIYTDSEGRMFFFDRSVGIRNRQAEIETFADMYVDSPFATQQEYYGSIKAGA
jgi:hypothetical protein